VWLTEIPKPVVVAALWYTRWYAKFQVPAPTAKVLNITVAELDWEAIWSAGRVWYVIKEPAVTVAVEVLKMYSVPAATVTH
jgi:hypothetical protein